MTGPGHVLGASATAFAGAGAVTGAAFLCRTAVRDLTGELAAGGWQGLAFETILAALAALVLAACVAWLGLATVLTVVDLVTGLGHAAATRVTPAAVRRVVAVACGAALGSSVVWTAHGAEAPGAASPAQTAWRPAAGAHLLTGLPLPDRATGLRAALRTPPSAGGVHVVGPGQSLWSITAEALGPGADTTDVAEGWRRLYAVNRDRVGDDPDLLLPGTNLRLPATWPVGRDHHPPRREDPS